MKKSDDKERQEWFEAAVKEVWAPGENDDGVIRDSNQTQNEKDHKVAEELESKA